jgi:hypothetical protein
MSDGALERPDGTETDVITIFQAAVKVPPRR